ncbi:hypothetical protein CBS101457_006933 [Exobasidium rhododendri]|nr:hypothetical protein CBS101457_006933 [Exobasidium rhododendri]
MFMHISEHDSEEQGWCRLKQNAFHDMAHVLFVTTRRFIKAYTRHTKTFLACILFLVVVFRPLTGQKHVTRIDQYALDIWIDHINTHPVRADDRYGLAEAGFRASMYAELIRRKQEQFLPGLEEGLWKFVNSPVSLRESRTNNQLESHRKNKLTRRNSSSSNNNNQTHPRGIVMCVTTQTAHLAFPQIEAIHGVLNSSLPIEIFFYGQAELPETLQQAFETLPGVTTSDLMNNGMFDESVLHHEGLDISPRVARQSLALLATTFSEIIYIEPETVLLQDPETMFGSPEYLQTGTLFFRQAQMYSHSSGVRFLNMLRSQLDKEQPSRNLASSPFWNFEADQYQNGGVALFDRRRPGIFVALLFNAWLNSANPRETLWNLHYRDMTEEILWLAFELARIPYSFVSSSPGAVGRINEDSPGDGRVCSPKPLHFSHGRRGGASSLPMWFEGPLMLDTTHSTYFRPNAYIDRGKWEAQKTHWCFAGSDVRSLEVKEEHEYGGKTSMAGILEQLMTSNTKSSEKFQGLLSYFHDV